MYRAYNGEQTGARKIKSVFVVSPICYEIRICSFAAFKYGSLSWVITLCCLPKLAFSLSLFTIISSTPH